jgi:hypothetical protein
MKPEINAFLPIWPIPDKEFLAPTRQRERENRLYGFAFLLGD